MDVLPGNLIAQRVPLHELGHDVELSVELVERVDGADARMCEDRGGARFAAKPIAMARLTRQLRRDGLERNGAAKAAVRREIHAPHAAAANLADDGIRSQDGARLERVLFFEQVRRRLGDRLHEKRTSPRVVFQEGPYLCADHGIIGRSRFEPVQRCRADSCSSAASNKSRARRRCSGFIGGRAELTATTPGRAMPAQASIAASRWPGKSPSRRRPPRRSCRQST